MTQKRVNDIRNKKVKKNSGAFSNLKGARMFFNQIPMLTKKCPKFRSQTT